MYGTQIAFRQFNVVDGITRSPWIGMKNFEFFFKSQFFLSTTFNTLFINVMIIGTGLLFQVGTAILLNEVAGRRLKKLYQTAMFFPFFISWIVVSAFLQGLLNDRFGLINHMLRSMGGSGVVWYNEAALWPYFLTLIAVWKGLGYGTVIYLAKITGIDVEILEAARIDGANKRQEILHIILPGLQSTVVMLLLINLGGIFNGDFGMIYSIVGEKNSMLLPTTDIINTYVFRAMKINSQYGMAAAVGLWQSVMGFILVLISNYLVRRRDSDMAIF
jgi:putative aldouronate transport system permease protein